MSILLRDEKRKAIMGGLSGAIRKILESEIEGGPQNQGKKKGRVSLFPG